MNDLRRHPLLVFAHCASLLLSSAAVASAQADASERWSEATPSLRDVTNVWAVELGLRLGVASGPFFAPAFPHVHGNGLVLQPRAAWRIDQSLLLGVELPIAMISVAEPAGSYRDVYSWGNANLFLRRRDEVWRSGGTRLYRVLGAAVAAPIAQHGPADSNFNVRALQLASALDAFREQELFAAGALPLSASAGVLLEGEHVGFGAELRVPLFFQFSRAGLAAQTRSHPVGIAPLLHLGARVSPLSWLDISLAADCVFDRWASLEFADNSAARTQCSLTPLLSFGLGAGVRLRVEAVLPVAGPLGGGSYAGGLQLGFFH